jgi:hypothetical protein
MTGTTIDRHQDSKTFSAPVKPALAEAARNSGRAAG